MNHDIVVASLCSNHEEITDRQPCVLVEGRPHLDAEFHFRRVGVAHELVVWCVDCGGYVARVRLDRLLVFDRERVTEVQLPIVPMSAKLRWGTA